MAKRGRPFVPVLQRFWSKVRKTEGCWIWTGGLSGRMGEPVYGYFHPTHDTTVLAHRFSYELVYGLLLPCVELDHLCLNTFCVRPDHLVPVAKTDNRPSRIGYCVNHDAPDCQVCRKKKERYWNRLQKLKREIASL